MLLGTPVVASHTGGIPSMLEHEKEGFLFEKGNVKALAETIMRTWEDDKMVDIMTENASVRARRTHDADENYDALMGIYNEISKSVK